MLRRVNPHHPSSKLHPLTDPTFPLESGPTLLPAFHLHSTFRPSRAHHSASPQSSQGKKGLPCFLPSPWRCLSRCLGGKLNPAAGGFWVSRFNHRHCSGASIPSNRREAGPDSQPDELPGPPQALLSSQSQFGSRSPEGKPVTLRLVRRRLEGTSSLPKTLPPPPPSWPRPARSAQAAILPRGMLGNPAESPRSNVAASSLLLSQEGKKRGGREAPLGTERGKKRLSTRLP